MTTAPNHASLIVQGQDRTGIVAQPGHPDTTKTINGKAIARRIRSRVAKRSAPHTGQTPRTIGARGERRPAARNETPADTGNPGFHRSVLARG
jgi:hypothetical protein